MKVVEKNKRQFLQKVPSLWRKQIFVHKDEDFAKHWIQPKFQSRLLTDKFRIVVTKRVHLKIIFTRGICTVIQWLCIVKSCCMHTKNVPGIFRIYVEHDPLKVQKLGFRMTCHFSLMHVLLNGQLRDEINSLTHERIRRDYQYIWTSHPSP